MQATTEWSFRQLWFSPSHCRASGSLLGLPCSASITTGHVASRATRTHNHTSQYICQVGQSTSLTFLVAILTSMVDVPAYPWSHLNLVREEGRRAFPPSNYLSSLAYAYCSTSFCHHLSQRWGICHWEQDAPDRGGVFTRCQLGYLGTAAYPPPWAVCSPSFSLSLFTHNSVGLFCRFHNGKIKIQAQSLLFWSLKNSKYKEMNTYVIASVILSTQTFYMIGFYSQL